MNNFSILGIGLGVAALIAVGASMTVQAAERVPNFQVADENPNSVRHVSTVSPRDYLLQVSGYYFGSAG
ncbi:MAG: hypothetical protein O2960_14345 [Verrucomicrobia bacterium]|nr:hypothetical protein [Verrucomicrobiota bacterium]